MTTHWSPWGPWDLKNTVRVFGYLYKQRIITLWGIACNVWWLAKHVVRK